MTEDLDELLTLEGACSFLGGNGTAATLRAEQRRGNLELYKIGKRLYTTRRDLKEMQRKCRVPQEALGSISTSGASNGLSETDRISSVQAALSQTTRELTRSSRNTSAQDTGRQTVRRRS
jgi:hypothetical protein